MTLTSYAQNFEDVLLWRALGDVEHGKYIDIGAQHPEHDSVSYAFYLKGWRGLHVEPTPSYAAALRAHREDETIVEAAAGARSGLITIYDIDGTGLTTGIADIACHHEAKGWTPLARTVPVLQLNSLFDHFASDDIHWLKIDVEGMEADVLRGWGTHPARPWVLVIESTFPNSQIPTHEEWINLVLERGYTEVYFDGLSRYFLAESHQHRAAAFVAPPNIFDNFRVTYNHFSALELRLQRDHEIAALHAEYQGLLATLAKAFIDYAIADREELQRRTERLQGDISAFLDDIVALRPFVDVGESARPAVSSEADSISGAERLHEKALALGQKLSVFAVDNSNALASIRAMDVEGISWVEPGEVGTRALGLRISSINLANETCKRELAALEHEFITGRTFLHWEYKSALNARLHAVSLAKEQQAIAIREAVSQLDQLHRSGSWRWLKILRNISRTHDRIVLALSNVHINQDISSMPAIAIKGYENVSGHSPQQENEGCINWNDGYYPMIKPSTLHDLLNLSDIDFIKSSYSLILGRSPDADGATYYLARLRAGTHKLEILKQLRQSAEGRKVRSGLPGLDAAIAWHRFFNLPFLGGLVRVLAGKSRNSQVERQLRIIANEIARIRIEQTAFSVGEANSSPFAADRRHMASDPLPGEKPDAPARMSQMYRRLALAFARN